MGSATVTLTNVPPTVTVDKTASPLSRPAPGGTFTFAVNITNTSFEPVTITTLTDDKYGNLGTKGTCTTAVGTVLAPGATYSCSFPGVFNGASGQSQTDVVTVVVVDNDNSTATANDNATVTLTGPRLSVDKTASPLSRPAPGGTFTFTVGVTNTGTDPATITSLVDDVYGNLNGKGTCAVGAAVAPGGTYTCSFPGDFTGTAGQSQTDIVTAVARDAQGVEGRASDNATVTIAAPPPPPPPPPPPVAPTGSVAVVKAAPADAQGVPFVFSIACPGAAGSPFSRSVTGSGTTPVVDNLPVGTACSAHEEPIAGFVLQPDRPLPAVTAGSTQTATFTNQRVPADAPSADLAVDISHSGTFAAGQNGTFNVRVTNHGPAPTSEGTIIVTLTLPGGVSFVSGSGGGFVCSGSVPTVTCTRIASLPAGASADIVVVVALSADVGSSFSVVAQVSDPNTNDPNPINNFDVDQVTVVGGATTTSAPPAPSPGGTSTRGGDVFFSPTGGFAPVGPGGFGIPAGGVVPVRGVVPVGVATPVGVPTATRVPTGAAPQAAPQQQQQQQQSSAGSGGGGAPAPASASSASAAAAAKARAVDGGLPFTGSSSRLLALVGGLVLALGVAAVTASRLALLPAGWSWSRAAASRRRRRRRWAR